MGKESVTPRRRWDLKGCCEIKVSNYVALSKGRVGSVCSPCHKHWFSLLFSLSSPKCAAPLSWGLHKVLLSQLSTNFSHFPLLSRVKNVLQKIRSEISVCNFCLGLVRSEVEFEQQALLPCCFIFLLTKAANFPHSCWLHETELRTSSTRPRS